MFEMLPESLESFHYGVLSNAIYSLRVNYFPDNFDAKRFNLDGNDYSLSFDAQGHAVAFQWFVQNSSRLFQAFLILETEASKRLYLSLILYRLAGHLSVRLPVDFAKRTEDLAAYNIVEKSVPSDLDTTGVFGGLRHFDFQYEGHRYVADCLGFEAYLFRRQYFYNRDGLRICPEPGDTVIDGGACTGDTAAVFSNAVGRDGKVFSFDPVAEHLDILRHNIAHFTFRNVKAMPYGLSDHDVDAEPLILNQYAPGFRTGGQDVPLRTIDGLVESNEIQRIDYIKLDVEGAEFETLAGAHRSIDKFKPKLAVSLYHKPDDIFDLILSVKERFPFYKCNIDHYTIHQEETVLYCIAE